MERTMRLKSLLALHGYSVNSFCRVVDLSRDKFYRKLSTNCATFNVDEINKIASVLGLNNEQILYVFFL